MKKLILIAVMAVTTACGGGGGSGGNTQSLTPYFFAADNGNNGRELWVTDGTDDGTRMVKDINQGGLDNAKVATSEQESQPGSSPSDFVAIGDVTYFVAFDGQNGRELWRTDGTEEGTKLVKDIKQGGNRSFINDMTRLNNQVIFTVPVFDDVFRELWVSDGTEVGTRAVFTEGQENSIDAFTLHEGAAYFVYSTDRYGRELWKTDGSSIGTTLVADLNEGPDSFCFEQLDMVSAGQYLYFESCEDGTKSLWRTDGTMEGTQSIGEINANIFSQLILFKGDAYFSGDIGDGMGFELWKTDGNDIDRVKDINTSGGSWPGNYILYKDSLYFTAYDGKDESVLWRTDGTEQGTVRIDSPEASDLDLSGISLREKFVFDDQLFFSENLADSGEEWWSFDGSRFILLKDIAPGGESSSPWPLIDYRVNTGSSRMITTALFNGRFIFGARNATFGNELWISNGTESGTKLLKDINPDTGDGVSCNCG